MRNTHSSVLNSVTCESTLPLRWAVGFACLGVGVRRSADRRGRRRARPARRRDHDARGRGLSASDSGRITVSSTNEGGRSCGTHRLICLKQMMELMRGQRQRCWSMVVLTWRHRRMLQLLLPRARRVPRIPHNLIRSWSVSRKVFPPPKVQKLPRAHEPGAARQSHHCLPVAIVIWTT
eukprot:COSAG02_NODE_5914_length_3942_cov_1.908665_2_plen_178_part_00